MLTLELLVAVQIFLSSDTPSRQNLDRLVREGNSLIDKCHVALSNYTSGFKYLTASSLAMDAAKPAISQWRDQYDVRLGNMEKSVDEYLANLSPHIQEGIREAKLLIRPREAPKCTIYGILLGLFATNLDEKRIDRSERLQYATSMQMRTGYDYHSEEYETRTRLRFP